METLDSNNLPQGFRRIDSEGDAPAFEYRNQKRTAAILFLIAWNAVFLPMALILILNLDFENFRDSDFDNKPFIFILVTILLWVFGLYHLVLYLLLKTTYVFAPDSFVIRKTIGGWIRQTEFKRSHMQDVTVVCKSYRESDSPDLWWIEIRGETTKKLMFNQGPESCQWFGEVIATTYGVELIQNKIEKAMI